ncbi:MAG: hypothetical protein ACI9TF_000344 [Paracrocinitomix sp.]|jgi:hypothetical protein
MIHVVLGVAVITGELVGRGRTSDMYAYDPDSVVKIPHVDVPASQLRRDHAKRSI